MKVIHNFSDFEHDINIMSLEDNFPYFPDIMTQNWEMIVKNTGMHQLIAACK